MTDRGPLGFEALEPRTLLSVSIEIDYTYDSNGFFDDADRRVVMEAAADYLGSLLNDSLSAIVPGGPNEWRLRFNDPSSGTPVEVTNPTIDEDELLVFVGGRDLGGDTLGLGGAGGWQAVGTSTFLNIVEGRGQSGATGPDAGQTDTALWGGSIAFDTDTNWHFGLTTEGLAGNEHDFYSVALHEMIHVLGFSDGTPAFANLISISGEFMGPASMAVSADTSLLPGDPGHWDEGLSSAGQETLMDPTFSRGIRKLVTPLDFAAMQDIGWELDALRWPGRGSAVPLSVFTGAGVGSGNASPGSPGLHWVDPRQGGVLDFRITSDAPVSLRVWDSRGLLVQEVATADVLTGLGFAATDQIYSIEIISGSSTASYNLAVSSSGFDELAYSPEGFASADIEQVVSIGNPTDSAQLYTLVLRYERDDLGREFDVVAFERLIEPGSVQTIDIVRDGVFATDEPSGRGILGSQPYAIVLESTAPLTASLEHEDEFAGRDISTAETFTRSSDDSWRFARAEKAAGVFDFLVFYNPNDHDVRVTMQFRDIGGQRSFTQDVRAGARGGLNLQDTGDLPSGLYGVVVSSVAIDPADQPSHEGIVAGLSHFDSNTGLGWTTLGTPGALPNSGMTPLAGLPGATVRALIFNPGSTTARLELTRFTGSGSESLADRFVPAGTSASIPLDAAVGYEYTFTGGQGLIQFVQSTPAGSGSSSSRINPASTLAFALSDLDDDPADLLRLTIANDSAFNAIVTVRFLFASGGEITQNVIVAGMDFGTLDIDTLTNVTARANGGPLSIILESNRAIDALLAFQDAEEFWSSGGMVLPG